MLYTVNLAYIGPDGTSVFCPLYAKSVICVYFTLQKHTSAVFCLSHAIICWEIVILMAISSLKNES
jgi:hypothetical protein